MWNAVSNGDLERPLKVISATGKPSRQYRKKYCIRYSHTKSEVEWNSTSIGSLVWTDSHVIDLGRKPLKIEIRCDYSPRSCLSSEYDDQLMITLNVRLDYTDCRSSRWWWQFDKLSSSVVILYRMLGAHCRPYPVSSSPKTTVSGQKPLLSIRPQIDR